MTEEYFSICIPTVDSSLQVPADDCQGDYFKELADFILYLLDVFITRNHGSIKAFHAAQYLHPHIVFKAFLFNAAGYIAGYVKVKGFILPDIKYWININFIMMRDAAYHDILVCNADRLPSGKCFIYRAFARLFPAETHAALQYLVTFLPLNIRQAEIIILQKGLVGAYDLEITGKYNYSLFVSCAEYF